MFVTLPKPPVVPGGNARRPRIPIDADALTVQVFLDAISNRSLSIRVDQKVDTYEEVIRLCDVFECHMVSDYILIRLGELAMKEPMNLFILASRRGKVQLAKTALRFMWNDNLASELDLHAFPNKLAAQIPIAYLLPLLRLLPSNKPRSHARHGCLKQRSFWDHVERSFEPTESYDVSFVLDNSQAS